jgi:hypothetical protein
MVPLTVPQQHFSAMTWRTACPNKKVASGVAHRLLRSELSEFPVGH